MAGTDILQAGHVCWYAVSCTELVDGAQSDVRVWAGSNDPRVILMQLEAMVGGGGGGRGVSTPISLPSPYAMPGIDVVKGPSA
eukprot:3941963-Rhodomonas_salina.4